MPKPLITDLDGLIDSDETNNSKIIIGTCVKETKPSDTYVLITAANGLVEACPACAAKEKEIKEKDWRIQELEFTQLEFGKFCSDMFNHRDDQKQMIKIAELISSVDTNKVSRKVAEDSLQQWIHDYVKMEHEKDTEIEQLKDWKEAAINENHRLKTLHIDIERIYKEKNQRIKYYQKTIAQYLNVYEINNTLERENARLKEQLKINEKCSVVISTGNNEEYEFDYAISSGYSDWGEHVEHRIELPTDPTSETPIWKPEWGTFEKIDYFKKERPQ